MFFVLLLEGLLCLAKGQDDRRYQRWTLRRVSALLDLIAEKSPSHLNLTSLCQMLAPLH
jgi:hypothetical protein